MSTPRPRFCPGCGKDISNRRAHAVTCGQTCRQRFSRFLRKHPYPSKRPTGRNTNP